MKPLYAAQRRAPTGLPGTRYGLTRGDLSVHVDPSSTAVARSLGASAFTFQDEVYVDRSYYRPETPAGRHLLGHEAAHISGQRRSHADAARAPHIHRSMVFSMGASQATYTMYDKTKEEKDKREESDPLFTEWVNGLDDYLGLKAVTYVDYVSGPR